MHTVDFRMTLRDTTSHVVAEVKTTKGRDQSTHTFTPNVLLEELTPGAYALVLEAESSLSPGKPVSRQIPFRVIAAGPAVNGE